MKCSNSYDGNICKNSLRKVCEPGGRGREELKKLGMFVKENPDRKKVFDVVPKYSSDMGKSSVIKRKDESQKRWLQECKARQIFRKTNIS